MIKKRYFYFTLFFALASASYSGFGAEIAVMREPISPLTAGSVMDSRKVALGRKLFSDPILSKDGNISCSSCHDLRRAGTDGKVASVGISGAVGHINSPSVFNSGFNFRQFWNGRAASLEEQIDGPVQNPIEMGSDWRDVVGRIEKKAEFQKLFQEAYPTDGVSPGNIRDALATFERTLISLNSRFDQYLLGNQASLNAEEKKGYAKFKTFGCIACHQGMNVGGNMFQTMGVMGNYFLDRGTKITEEDLGRYNFTKAEADKYVFRVPSLRNVELTAPYFHDGSAKTLNEAIVTMAKYQLGLKLSKEDVAEIAAFLRTLTGEMPKSIQDEK